MWPGYLEKKAIGGNFIRNENLALMEKKFEFFIYCFTVKMRLP